MIGKKVMVYGFDYRNGCGNKLEFSGVVKSVAEDGMLLIKPDDYQWDGYFHPNQCKEI